MIYPGSNITSDKEADTSLIIEEYINRLTKSLEDIPVDVEADIVKEMRAHIEDAVMGGDNSMATVRAILEDLGDPEEYAQILKDSGYIITRSNNKLILKSSGRILGMPYDIGLPTVKKIADRLWNPTDPRILVPKIFGIGWDINFAALAVKLGLLRPDDEDDPPFEQVPDRVLSLGLLLPAILVVASVAIAIIYFKALPPQVPVHFGISGQPDNFASPAVSIAWWLTPPVLMLAILYFAAFARRASRLARALSVAFLTSVSIINCTSFMNSVYYALNGRTVINASLIVLSGLAAFFLVLVTLSRIGLREQWFAHNVLKNKKSRKKEDY